MSARALAALALFTSIVLFTATAPHLGWAANSSRAPGRGAHRAPSIIDNGSRMDANNLDMVVTNHGSVAYDLITGNSGLVYPKGSTQTAVFAAGPWIGALVNGELRVAVGEYSQEFVPGPMRNGTFLPDQLSFRNWEIQRGITDSFDYLNWPVQDGAPTEAGLPKLSGDDMIWSVYNDADPSVHFNNAGSTAPLGIEVRQSTFAFNRSGPLGNTIFMRFQLANRGFATLEDMYFTFWSDPDLGGATDDLVGCDITRSLGYCYNATNADQQYGSHPPAVGFDLLRGPVAFRGGGVYDTLGMTSFNKFVNGTDPTSHVETYNYMKGLHADGTEIHVNDDPLAPVTTYQVSGDPVTGAGWLDSSPGDRRLLISSGPFAMAPGDAQEIVLAIVIGQGTDRLSSITDLRNKDDVVQILFDSGALANRAPVAQVGGPYTGFVGVPVALDGTGSSDPDGDPLSYSWLFGDGSAGTGATPMHAYAQSGLFGVSLTVSDGFLTNVGTTTASIVAVFTARAFTAGGNGSIRLATGKPTWCAQIEAVGGGYENAVVDRETIVMKSPGTGSVDEISARLEKSLIGADRDRNGIEEITACFSKADLRLLFANVRGNTSVPVTIEGAVVTGGRFQASMDVGIVAGGGGLAATVSPNPLNPSAALTFVTERSGPLRVGLFDVSGRLVKSLLSRASAPPGYYTVTLDGRLPSGVYFYKIESAGETVSGTATILK